MLLKELKNGNLVGSLHNKLLCLVSIRKAQTALCFQVGNQVAALVVGDTTIHRVQLMLQDEQTLIDETAGRDGQFVTVIQPHLVIH